MRLASREDAARRLAARLHHLRAEQPLILGVPNGGVPMARIVADTLGADLDVVLVRRLRAENDPEATIGAISEDGEVHLDAHRRISAAWVARERRAKLESLHRRRASCPVGPRFEVAGRTVVVVDDAITTGSTITAALRGLRQAGARRIVVAVGAAPESVRRAVEPRYDEWVCELLSTYAGPSGHWYEQYPKVPTSTLPTYLTREPATA